MDGFIEFVAGCLAAVGFVTVVMLFGVAAEHVISKISKLFRASNTADLAYGKARSNTSSIIDIECVIEGHSYEIEELKKKKGEK